MGMIYLLEQKISKAIKRSKKSSIQLQILYNKIFRRKIFFLKMKKKKKKLIFK